LIPGAGPPPARRRMEPFMYYKYYLNEFFQVSGLRRLRRLKGLRGLKSLKSLKSFGFEAFRV
jgi:hypothetical protein